MSNQAYTMIPCYGGKEAPGTFRHPVNVAELIRYASSVHTIWAIGNDGTARRAKVNGKVRTWKRDAERVEIPYKYGLYEYGTFGASDLTKVLIPIEWDNANEFRGSLAPAIQRDMDNQAGITPMLGGK